MFRYMRESGSEAIVQNYRAQQAAAKLQVCARCGKPVEELVCQPLDCAGALAGKMVCLPCNRTLALPQPGPSETKA